MAAGPGRVPRGATGVPAVPVREVDPTPGRGGDGTAGPPRARRHPWTMNASAHRRDRRPLIALPGCRASPAASATPVTGRPCRSPPATAVRVANRPWPTRTHDFRAPSGQRRGQGRYGRRNDLGRGSPHVHDLREPGEPVRTFTLGPRSAGTPPVRVAPYAHLLDPRALRGTARHPVEERRPVAPSVPPGRGRDPTPGAGPSAATTWSSACTGSPRPVCCVDTPFFPNRHTYLAVRMFEGAGRGTRTSIP